MSDIILTPKQEDVFLRALCGVIRERSMPELGRRIRGYRAKHSLRLLDMAKALNMGSAELSGIETGRKPMPADFSDRVKAIYGEDCFE